MVYRDYFGGFIMCWGKCKVFGLSSLGRGGVRRRGFVGIFFSGF